MYIVYGQHASLKGLGNLLYSGISSSQNAYDALKKVQQFMVQMINGDDYSVVEAEFGIPSNGQTGSSSAGYAVKYQIDSVISLMENSAFQQALSQLG